MIKENSKTISNIFLSILPFIFFIIIIIIPDSINNSWESWYLKSKVNAYIMLSLTSLMIFLKSYKERWFYIWLGFTIYFSSCFILDNIIGFSKMITYFNYSPSIISDVNLNLYFHFVPDLFYIVNIILFFILFRKFKVELEKIFYLIFVYYFVYCYFLFEQYQASLSFNTDVTGIVKCSVLLNSFISILFLVFINLEKKKGPKIISFIVFLLLNFLTINLSQIESLISAKLINLCWNYMKYFLIYSKLIYLLSFLILLILYQFIKGEKEKGTGRKRRWMKIGRKKRKGVRPE